MKVFDRLEPYGFIHHRALNDFPSLEAAMGIVRAHPGRSHVLEGDVCWNFAGGRSDIYFHHPDWVVNRLGGRAIDRAVAAGTLVRLEDLSRLADEDVLLVLELKIGTGDWRRALAGLLGFMREAFADRFWIDGFSLRLLRAVREMDPGVALSLHTELVTRGHALIGAPEWPPVGVRRLSGLDEVDAVAVRWHGPEDFMRRACADVLAAGKVPVLSRIHDLDQFACSRRWQARAGYIHGDFDRLAACSDAFDRESGGGATDSALARQGA